MTIQEDNSLDRMMVINYTSGHIAEIYPKNKNEYQKIDPFNL